MDRDNRGSNIGVIVIIIAVITIATAGASTSSRVSSYLNSDSIVDCLQSLGKPSSLNARRKLAEAEIHPEWREKMTPYRGTAKQNRHMIADFCGGVSKIARHPKVSEAERRVIISGLREIARENGVDEDKFVNTAKCESSFYSRALGDGGRSRGIFQFHNGYRREVSDEVAYDWRRAAHVAARDFRTERVIWSKKKQKHVFRSEAFQWTCYRKLYGTQSARASSQSSRSIASSGQSTLSKVALAWGSN